MLGRASVLQAARLALAIDGARLGGWCGDTRRSILTQVEELDERMQKLTHKLENARRDMVRGAASEAYAVYETSHALLPRLGRHVRSHDG